MKDSGEDSPSVSVGAEGAVVSTYWNATTAWALRFGAVVRVQDIVRAPAAATWIVLIPSESLPPTPDESASTREVWPAPTAMPPSTSPGPIASITQEFGYRVVMLVEVMPA